MILVSSSKEAVTHKVFIGIGSNYEREKNITLALTALRDTFGELLLSNVYETVAMDSLARRNHANNYYNLAVGLNTKLSPLQTNQCLKAIETSAGIRRNKVCPLDIDLLLYDDLIQHDAELDLPRRDILDYAYVTIPLVEINADQRHPETGKTFKEHSQSDNITHQKVWLTNFNEGKIHVS